MSLPKPHGHEYISGWQENGREYIPPMFAGQIVDFLEKQKSGKLILNIKDGKILVLDIQESIRL